MQSARNHKSAQSAPCQQPRYYFFGRLLHCLSTSNGLPAIFYPLGNKVGKIAHFAKYFSEIETPWNFHWYHYWRSENLYAWFLLNWNIPDAWTSINGMLAKNTIFSALASLTWITGILKIQNKTKVQILQHYLTGWVRILGVSFIVTLLHVGQVKIFLPNF